jgi:hypothetical protein
LPETIPIHFGFSGEADSWGRRWMIFLLPVIATFILAIEYLAFNYGVIRANRPVPESAKVPMHLLMLELSAIFTYITWRTTEVAFGRARGLGVWFLPVMLFVVLSTCGWMWLAGRGN